MYCVNLFKQVGKTRLIKFLDNQVSNHRECIVTEYVKEIK